MRLATYRSPAHRDGRAAAVVRRDDVDHIVDLATASSGALPHDLLALLEAGPDALALAGQLAGQLAATGVGVPVAEVELLAAAGNYQAHIVEGGLPPVDKSRIVPKLFLKPSSSIIGPQASLRLPTTLSAAVDWELELAVVIGAGGRNISVENALAAVAGYTIINDISARSMSWGLPDRQENAWNGFFDWLNGKWLDGFAPMGPWIVTADEAPDPDALRLGLAVNGETRQQASTAEMIFNTAELISFASRMMTLEPGDVIATGTPAGVGDTTGVYLSPGDTMEGWIDGLGVLRTVVESQPDGSPCST